jgi:hypothetical protein
MLDSEALHEISYQNYSTSRIYVVNVHSDTEFSESRTSVELYSERTNVNVLVYSYVVH